MNKLRISAAVVLLAMISSAYGQFTVPVSKSLVQTLLVKAFPRVIDASGGKILFADPEMLFLKGDRIGLRTRLSRNKATPGGSEKTADTHDGMMLVSGQLKYEQKTQRFVIHKPRMDSLVMLKDDKQSASLTKDIQAYWKKHAVEPVIVEIPENPYTTSFKSSIKDVIVSNDSISLVLGLP